MSLMYIWYTDKKRGCDHSGDSWQRFKTPVSYSPIASTAATACLKGSKPRKINEAKGGFTKGKWQVLGTQGCNTEIELSNGYCVQVQNHCL